jgi:hypothetical protein
MPTNENAASSYKASTKLQKGMRVGKISRSDVAHFSINEAENPKMLFEYAALTN